MSTAAQVVETERNRKKTMILAAPDLDLGALEKRISELQWMGMGHPLTLKEDEELTRLRTAYALYTMYA